MVSWISRITRAAVAASLILGGASGALAQHNRHDARVLRVDPRLSDGQIAPVLEGLGRHARDVTANSDRTKLFFNQGLRLTYD